jgi:hypothetical protein
MASIWSATGISKLEVIFCAFLAENNFVNALILFIRAKKVQGSRFKVQSSKFKVQSSKFKVQS